jgi:hypothetical protein
MHDSARWYIFSPFLIEDIKRPYMHVPALQKIKSLVMVPSFTHRRYKDKIVQKEAVTSIIHGEWLDCSSVIHRH